MISHRDVAIADISGRFTQGVSEIDTLSSRERLIRASVRGSIFFGIAVVSIFIPFLHFILVPAFLIVAVAAFVVTLNQTQIIVRITGPCPSCEKAFALENLKVKDPMKEHCPLCRQSLKLKIASQDKI